jgi:hypothetical protein
MNTYPRDWKKIAARAGERAGWRCQRCRVGYGELYTRFSGRVVSENEFKRLGTTATRARRQEAKKRDEAIAQARARSLSPLISEAEMAGDLCVFDLIAIADPASEDASAKKNSGGSG